MVFGKRRIEEPEISQNDIYSSSSDENEEDVEIQESREMLSQPQSSRRTSQQTSLSENRKTRVKPLLVSEVTFEMLGKTKQWRCKYCKNAYKSSTTRISYHLIGPPVGKSADIARCEVVQKNFELFQNLRNKAREEEKIKGGGKDKTKNPIEEAMQTMAREVVDMKVIRAFCANGIPFNVLRNPQFHEMVTAINNGPKGYKAPGYERARTTLLDACKIGIENELKPVRETWLTHGVSIVSDGWSNMKHNPLINVVAVNSRGCMFLYVDDFSGVTKSGKEIADYLLKAIEQVGGINVIQVVTDNAKNCVAVGQEIRKVHKHIFWFPCVVHTLNLIFKDLAENFDWLRSTYKKGKSIVKFYLNHIQALTMFRSHSKLELLKVAKTRFASHYILLKRLSMCREALETTVVLKAWKDWLKNQDVNLRAKAANVVELVQSDCFWDEVDSIIKITKPIYLLVKFCDGDGQKMGEIYEKMDSMLGEIKDIMTRDGVHGEYFSDVEQIVVSRWEKMNIPLHCLAFALTPRFYDGDYLRQMAPGGTTTKAPNEDAEVTKGVLEAFGIICDDPSEKRELFKQYATFVDQKGIYATLNAQADAVAMPAIDWWSIYGSETRELAEVAKKVLSQPISSSSAERVWSTYSYIHNVKRNRLNCTRANNLVFVHSNIRLISRFSKTYEEGAYKKWDINPEEDHVERLEELQRLSLEDKDQDAVGSSSRNKCTKSKDKGKRHA